MVANFVFVQARMGSTRLPGKTLKPIKGHPLIWYVIERLKQMTNIDDVIILTSEKEVDDELVDWCDDHEVGVFRGSEDNVLERYYEAAKFYDAENIIRATGDNPFVLPLFAEKLLNNHLKKDADYSSNKSEVGATLPDGLGVEIFSFEALKRSAEKSDLPHHFEHVNEYILENKCLFNIYEDKSAGGCTDHSHIRLTVDTPADFRKAAYMIGHKDFRMDFSLEELLDVEKTYSD